MKKCKTTYINHNRNKNSGLTTMKPVHYKIGDLVILYKSQLYGKQKLEERSWSGPYYIHEVLPNGTYKLRTKGLKTPINYEQLKPYHPHI